MNTHYPDRKEYSRQYRLKNREKINKKQQQYYRNNKQKLLENQKIYNEKNREKINKKQQEYYTTHKQEIQAMARQKITCECGCPSTKSNIAVHRKTTKHKNLMNHNKLVDDVIDTVKDKMKGLEKCKAYLETHMGKLTDEEYLTICEAQKDNHKETLIN